MQALPLNRVDEFIKSEQDLVRILNQIDSIAAQNKPKVISQEDPRFQGIMNRMTGRNVIKGDFGPGFKEEIEKMNIDKTIQNILKMEPIDAMKEANKVIKREGIYKALNKKQAKKILDDTEDHIFERNIKPSEFDPEDMAEGGRIGLKTGMSRRAFLKLMGGVGAGIGALKTGILKLAGKEGARQVTKNIIKTDPVPGKPAWFDALVTKVINEGEDVTKRFATGERQTVHMKKLDDDTTVMVTQDLDDGAIRVEYDSPENVYSDPVQLQYKKELPDEGNPNPSAEFTTAESGPVGRQYGPDDYEIEIDEVGGNSIRDLDSDLTRLKIYARGDNKPTLKEFVESKKRKDKAAAISEGGESEMDAVIRRQGEYEQFGDLPDEADFAKGGLAGMLGE